MQEFVFLPIPMSLSEPVAMRRQMKYILWFAQENVEFRAEELQSIAKTLNIRMLPEPQNYSPKEVRPRHGSVDIHS